MVKENSVPRIGNFFPKVLVSSREELFESFDTFYFQNNLFTPIYGHSFIVEHYVASFITPISFCGWNLAWSSSHRSKRPLCLICFFRMKRALVSYFMENVFYSEKIAEETLDSMVTNDANKQLISDLKRMSPRKAAKKMANSLLLG